MATIIGLARSERREFLESCTPGYYNNEGKPRRDGQGGSFIAPARTDGTAEGPIAFVKVLEDWRAEGALEGMELR